MQADHNDLAALRRQILGEAAAKHTAAARDDGNAPFEIFVVHHVVFPHFFAVPKVELISSCTCSFVTFTNLEFLILS